MDPPHQGSGIFISYRRDDADAYVEALSAPLCARFGASRIFRDTQSIRPGEDFVETINRQLGLCSVVLAVIGRSWATVVDPRTGQRRLDNERDFLSLELSTALKNKNVVVIPVLVGHSIMPSPDELPPDLVELGTRNAIELCAGSRWTSDVERLIRAVEEADVRLRKPRTGHAPLDSSGSKHKRRQGKSVTPLPPADGPGADRFGTPSATPIGGPQMVEHVSAPEAMWGDAWRRFLSFESRVGISALVAGVFVVNWMETAAETLVKKEFGLGDRLAYDLATAMSWFEGGLSFDRHDLSNGVAIYGGSVAYFFVYPSLLALTMIVLIVRRDVALYRAFAFAITVTYILSLACYVILPVPERWAFPDSQAVLLSDLWSAQLIRAVRPVSGLDNCFPSFHVSSSVDVVLVWYVYRLPFRLPIALLALAVLLSTFLLGIHWLPDIIAGVALGVVSVRIAQKMDHARYSTGAIHAS